MFQSVIQQSAAGRGRFGTGVWVSLLVHAGVLGGALLVSGVTQKLAPPKEPEVLIFEHRPAGPPQTTPPRLEQKPPPPKVAAKKPPAPRKTLRQPSLIPPPPAVEPQPVEPEPAEPTPSDEEASGETTASPLGSVVGEVIGLPTHEGPTCLNCPPGPALQGSGEETVPFGAGMTPPQLLSEGVPVRYTSDAIQAGVRGLLIARCTITSDGQVNDCRVIKGLPFMDQSVLESLESRRYRPVTFQGKPVNALYTFNVKLQMQ